MVMRLRILRVKSMCSVGGCSAFVTSTDRSYRSSLQAQPQIARYSLAIDAGSDVTPTNSLFNGIDNGFGARWYLSYRSATAGAASPCGNMTAWGAITDLANGVTLGTPYTYTPKNAAGTSTNCARYFFMALTVDASQSFGFPDDVTRGPTITDLSLQFFSAPGGRLMHGKSFNGGLQQPLDTPCRQSNNGSDPTYSQCALP